LGHVKILAYGGLDEYRISEFVRQEAPVDGFGVGTSLAVSDDAPGLDMAYKIASYAGKPRLKLSEDKATCPGLKQVFRSCGDGHMIGDVIGLYDEPPDGRLPLLVTAMKDGRRTTAGSSTLDQARAHARAGMTSLPEAIRSLEPAGIRYPVTTSRALDGLLHATRRRMKDTGSEPLR